MVVTKLFVQAGHSSKLHTSSKRHTSVYMRLVLCVPCCATVCGAVCFMLCYAGLCWAMLCYTVLCCVSLQVNSIVEEYFSSGDVGNAADSLSELDAPVATMGHYFVKRLLTLALDRKDKEREMASSLLSNLYAEVGALVFLIMFFLWLGVMHREGCYWLVG